MKIRRIPSHQVREGTVLRGRGGEPHLVLAVRADDPLFCDDSEVIGVAWCDTGHRVSLHRGHELEVFV